MEPRGEAGARANAGEPSAGQERILLPDEKLAGPQAPRRCQVSTWILGLVLLALILSIAVPVAMQRRANARRVDDAGGGTNAGTLGGRGAGGGTVDEVGDQDGSGGGDGGVGGDAEAPTAVERQAVMNAVTGEMFWNPAEPPDLEGAAHWKFELDTMLGMSYFFYEVNRAGRLPESTRPPWRGDTLRDEVSGGNLDGELEGGYFDAGDHLKFILPQAFTIGRLNWLINEFPTGLKSTHFDGQTNYFWAREAAKWGADFLVKGTHSNRTILHIGNIKPDGAFLDHSFIGRAEFYPQQRREIAWCPSGSCSDVAAAIAAALAQAATAFQDITSLSAVYWEKAQQAYAQIGLETGPLTVSSDFYPLGRLYSSTAPAAQAFFAAASMLQGCMKVTGLCTAAETEGYRQDALQLGVMKEPLGSENWFYPVPSWDNTWWDAAVLMSSLGEDGPTGVTAAAGQDGFFKWALKGFVASWVRPSTVDPISVSPEGQRFAGEWGSNRYALNGAAVLLLWARLPSEHHANATQLLHAQCAAVKQVHYVAGDNVAGSYVVGFGTNPPTRIQHRNSACTPQEHVGNRDQYFCLRFWYDVRDPANRCEGTTATVNGTCFPEANRDQPYVVHGALVGGPKTPTDAGAVDKIPYDPTGWNNWRTDWVANEVTIDYNAMYTLALAAAAELPSTFWRDAKRQCTGDLDLQLDSEAGLERLTPPPGPRSTSSYFADFKASYGFSRTLPATWFDDVPNMKTSPA